MDFLILGTPTKKLIQVSKRLYAGNDFNAKVICIIYDFTQFILGVSTAQISKIRLALYFVSIFRIQLKLIVAFQRNIADKLFQVCQIADSISGTIEHNAEFVGDAMFFHEKCFLCSVPF